MTTESESDEMGAAVILTGGEMENEWIGAGESGG